MVESKVFNVVCPREYFHAGTTTSQVFKPVNGACRGIEDIARGGQS